MPPFSLPQTLSFLYSIPIVMHFSPVSLSTSPMEWTDHAIILALRPYGESSAIVTLLTSQYGLHHGLVYGAYQKKNCGIYQTGNIVEARWRGRLREQLGHVSCTLSHMIAATFFHDALRLFTLQSLCALLRSTLPERDPQQEIFAQTHTLLHHFTTDSHWLSRYVAFEIWLLGALGFGLDLSCCAATGRKENLLYVSPKSGRAICADAGAPYHHKLLPLPDFLLHFPATTSNRQDIKNGLALASFFLDKYVFSPHGRSLPAERSRLLTMM